ncbi:dipeptidase PepE [Galbibacter sp.]|uniref:dipeptidase PepE n=1 Tax=Galbibacter sp. TaxID=2918471 RepID=UPI002BA78D75|nr:dipeptidase PepE [Galbibacter sp.]HLV61828.1 dipeptidase PepE [Galbibacter sp.]
MKKMLIASTSTLYEGTYLDYLQKELQEFFTGVDEIIFIPYARPGGISHDAYTEIAQQAFKHIGKSIIGLHRFEDPQKALKGAKGVFTGGGNTFLLVSQLYKFNVLSRLRQRIFEGMPYFGTSAGSNITGVTMQTTNDMPIIYPPSFKTLGAIPFNINPHYLDPVSGLKHMGETRETRIKEFHTYNSIPVVGLREGSWLDVKGDQITLKGALSARVFKQAEQAYELATGSLVEL